MIKVAQLIRSPADAEINPKDYFGGFDNGFFTKSLKRVGPIKVHVGPSGDDFLHKMISMAMEAPASKLARFMNPIRGRRKGKLKTL